MAIIQDVRQRLIHIPGPEFGVRVTSGYVSGGADWWDPDGSITCAWAAYQPKGAASFAASLTDLTGNGNNAIDPGGAGTPTWDAVNGWKFNGIAQYLSTTFTVQVDQSQSVIVQYTNMVPVAFHYPLGTWAGAGATMFSIWPLDGTPAARWSNGASIVVAPPLAVAGNAAVAGNTGYRNGVADAGAIGPWAGPNAFPLYIGGLNKAGALYLPMALYIQAFALYDCALTAPQVALVAAAMAAL